MALISRPRCASTSLRQILDKYLIDGDLRCDVAGTKDAFHPHISSTRLKATLRESGFAPEALELFTTMRNPIDLLHSYWRFFRPDISGCRYTFSPGWDPSKLIDFEDWILRGSARSPLFENSNWVSHQDLSPLSLEARAYRFSTPDVQHVFAVEEMNKIEDFLSVRLGDEIRIPSSNQGPAGTPSKLGAYALEKIRLMFRTESRFYAV